jgi:hypothetical protein
MFEEEGNAGVAGQTALSGSQIKPPALPEVHDCYLVLLARPSRCQGVAVLMKQRGFRFREYLPKTCTCLKSRQAHRFEPFELFRAA